jgi:hypothetical protein
MRCADLPHNSTLFDTVSHFRGTHLAGQANSWLAKPKFSNEVNDLARFLEAATSENPEQSQVLIVDSESATSAMPGARGHTM